MKLQTAKIEQIADLTDRNFHTNARILILDLMDKLGFLSFNDLTQLKGGYEFIEQQHTTLNHLPAHLSAMRKNLDAMLKDRVFKLFENAREIWGAL